MSWLTLRVLLVLSSCSWVRTSGQTSCSLPGIFSYLEERTCNCFMFILHCTVGAQFSLETVGVGAGSVNGSVRVTWNTTAPPQCVAFVTVEFRTSRTGTVVATYKTTNISQTEFIQTGLRCGAYYYITVKVTGETSDGENPTLSSRQLQVLVNGGKVPIAMAAVCSGNQLDSYIHCCTDIPTPVGVRAEVTADNTSIKMSWGWQSHNASICVNQIIVYYSGLQMMYTVGNSTAATSGTLPNLQCNTNYTIRLEARGGRINKWSQPVIVYLPAKGM